MSRPELPELSTPAERAPRGAAPDSEVSDSGVDLTLIRWMLSLTPTERLEALQGFADSVWALRDGRRS